MKWGRENGRYAWGTIKIQIFLTQTLRTAAKTNLYICKYVFFLLWLLPTKICILLVQNKTNVNFLKFHWNRSGNFVSTGTHLRSSIIYDWRYDSFQETQVCLTTFVKKSNAKFHKNSTNCLTAYSRSRTDCRTWSPHKTFFCLKRTPTNITLLYTKN
jgi:hypothetical protein